MSRFPKPLRNVALLALAVGAGGFAIEGVNRFLRKDPLASYRPGESGLGGDIGVQLQDVKFRHWEGTNLVAKCTIGTINVKKNRQSLEFRDITDGRYATSKGEFKFTGTAASYDSMSQSLSVSEGGHVSNADMDLTTPAFAYDARRGILRAPGVVQGTFFNGVLQAQNIEYHPREDFYRFGPASWEGKLPASLQEAAPASKRNQWRIKTDGVTEVKGNIETWPEAEATDGDVIVKATKIVRDTKTDVITATGKVLYFSADSNLVCEKAVIYRKEKRAVLTGKVQMLVKPDDQQKLEVIEIPPFRPMVPDEVAKDRPPAPPEDKAADQDVRDPKTRRKYPVAIYAGKIEYWYEKGNRHAVISDSPQARQDMAAGRWRAVWTTTAYYDAEKELLKLASAEGKKTTRVKTSLGDDLICDWYEISTKEDDDQWRAKGAEGVMYPDEDEIPPTKKDDKNKKPPPLSGKIGA